MGNDSKNPAAAPENYFKGAGAMSERLRSESAEDLRRVRARLASALEAGLAGTFYWDIERDRVTTDENMRSYFSLSEKATGAENAPLAEVLPAFKNFARGTAKI